MAHWRGQEWSDMENVFSKEFERRERCANEGRTNDGQIGQRGTEQTRQKENGTVTDANEAENRGIPATTQERTSKLDSEETSPAQSTHPEVQQRRLVSAGPSLMSVGTITEGHKKARQKDRIIFKGYTDLLNACGKDVKELNRVIQEATDYKQLPSPHKEIYLSTLREILSDKLSSTSSTNLLSKFPAPLLAVFTRTSAFFAPLLFVKPFPWAYSLLQRVVASVISLPHTEQSINRLEKSGRYNRQQRLETMEAAKILAIKEQQELDTFSLNTPDELLDLYVRRIHKQDFLTALEDPSLRTVVPNTSALLPETIAALKNPSEDNFASLIWTTLRTFEIPNIPVLELDVSEGLDVTVWSSEVDAMASAWLSGVPSSRWPRGDTVDGICTERAMMTLRKWFSRVEEVVRERNV